MNLRGWARRTHAALNSRSPVDRDRRYTQAEVEEVLRMAFDELRDALEEGDDLSIRKLGRLWMDTRPPRRVVSHLNGEVREYQVGERRRIRFQQSE